MEDKNPKEEYLPMVLHQLRSPLGAIRWNLEAALNGKEKLSGSVRDKIQYAHDNTLQLIELVRDLLEISKANQGDIKAQEAMVDLEGIISQITSSMRSEADAKKITINYEPQNGQMPKLWLDPERLREIIENLLTNAISYNKLGGNVTIRAMQIGSIIRLEISDTGIGIPEDVQEKIFSKFYRAPNAIKFKTDGTGLGLYVVKLYVEAWHGKIWFESQPEKGTTFFLELPVIQSPQ